MEVNMRKNFFLFYRIFLTLCIMSFIFGMEIVSAEDAYTFGVYSVKNEDGTEVFYPSEIKAGRITVIYNFVKIANTDENKGADIYVALYGKDNVLLYVDMKSESLIERNCDVILNDIIVDKKYEGKISKLKVFVFNEREITPFISVYELGTAYVDTMKEVDETGIRYQVEGMQYLASNQLSWTNNNGIVKGEYLEEYPDSFVQLPVPKGENDYYRYMYYQYKNPRYVEVVGLGNDGDINIKDNFHLVRKVQYWDERDETWHDIENGGRVVINSGGDGKGWFKGVTKLCCNFPTNIEIEKIRVQIYNENSIWWASSESWGKGPDCSRIVRVSIY